MRGPRYLLGGGLFLVGVAVTYGALTGRLAAMLAAFVKPSDLTGKSGGPSYPGPTWATPGELQTIRNLPPNVGLGGSIDWNAAAHAIQARAAGAAA